MKNLGINKKSLALLLAVVLTVGCAVGGTIAWLLDKTDEVVNTFSVGNIDIDLTETPNTDSTPDDGKAENDIWEAQIVPGYEFSKDPKVSVDVDSEPCWLFVQVDETEVSVSVDITDGESTTTKIYDYKDFVSYGIIEGWTAGKGTGDSGDGIPTNVYYRKITQSLLDEAIEEEKDTVSYDLIFNDIDKDGIKDNGEVSNLVSVNEDVTKEMLDGLEKYLKDNNKEMTLTFKAYAAQLYKTNLDEANSEFTAAEAWAILNPQ